MEKISQAGTLIPPEEVKTLKTVDFEKLEGMASTNIAARIVLEALTLNGDITLTLYDHQLEALLALAELKDCVIVTLCGSGKSRIINNAPLIVKLALCNAGKSVPDIPLAIENFPLNAIMVEKLCHMKKTCLLTMTGEMQFSPDVVIPTDGSDVIDQISHIMAHPESFCTAVGKNLLRKHKDRICVHIVDEVHCAFDWDNFREQPLPGTNRIFSISGTPMVALSASLRVPEQTDKVKDFLGMNGRSSVLIKRTPVLDHIFVNVVKRPSNKTDFFEEGGLSTLLNELCLDTFKADPLNSIRIIIYCQSDTMIRKGI